MLVANLRRRHDLRSTAIRMLLLYSIRMVLLPFAVVAAVVAVCCCCLKSYYRPVGSLVSLCTRNKKMPVNLLVSMMMMMMTMMMTGMTLFLFLLRLIIPLGIDFVFY